MFAFERQRVFRTGDERRQPIQGRDDLVGCPGIQTPNEIKVLFISTL